MYDVVLIVVLALVPMVLQLMAISVYMERTGRALRKAGDKPPYTTVVEIVELGPQPAAVARLLDRATRLDQDEVDQLVAQHGGRLPLPMSRPSALQLIQELQQLGALAVANSRRPRIEHGS